MDGYKKEKKNKYGKHLYSDTRYAVIMFLKRELPKVSGTVLNVSAGGWEVPKQLLDMKKVTSYTTFDNKLYGDSRNFVDVYGNVESMPFPDNTYDCLINNQALECYPDMPLAISEMKRVLKPGGILLLDVPFNVSHFGYGANPDTLKKKRPVMDYWRPTPQGVEYLLRGFSSVRVETSGPNTWNPHCIMARAIK